MVSEIIIGTILVGSLLIFIFLYFIQLFILLTIREKTGGKGIKNLKYQEKNHAWNQFVTRKEGK